MTLRNDYKHNSLESNKASKYRLVDSFTLIGSVSFKKKKGSV